MGRVRSRWQPSGRATQDAQLGSKPAAAVNTCAVPGGSGRNEQQQLPPVASGLLASPNPSVTSSGACSILDLAMAAGVLEDPQPTPPAQQPHTGSEGSAVDEAAATDEPPQPEQQQQQQQQQGASKDPTSQAKSHSTHVESAAAAAVTARASCERCEQLQAELEDSQREVERLAAWNRKRTREHGEALEVLRDQIALLEDGVHEARQTFMDTLAAVDAVVVCKLCMSSGSWEQAAAADGGGADGGIGAGSSGFSPAGPSKSKCDKPISGGGSGAVAKPGEVPMYVGRFCGHGLFCDNCGPQLECCPMCRERFPAGGKGLLRVYM